MGQLDDAVVAGDQACPDQLLEEALLHRVRRQRASRDAGPDGLALGAGRHQAQQQAAQLRPLLVRGLRVQLLGGVLHSAADAAAGAVAVHGERPSFALLPGCAQRMGQQRQRPRLPLDLAHQQVDQTRFEEQPGLARRTLDGGSQGGLVHCRQEVQAALQQPGETLVPGQVTQPVRAHGQHDGSTGGVGGDGGREPVALVGIGAERHRLLALVHDQHGRRA